MHKLINVKINFKTKIVTRNKESIMVKGTIHQEDRIRNKYALNNRVQNK